MVKRPSDREPEVPQSRSSGGSSPPSPERQRLDALLAEVRALRGGGTDTGFRPPPPPATHRQRWLLAVDLLVLSVIIYAVLTGTPLGALIRQGWGWAIGAPGDVRPVLSYFSQTTRARLNLAPLKEALERRVVRRRRGRERPSDPLPAAVAFLYADGRRDGPHFDVKLPLTARRALDSVAVTWPGEAAPAKLRQAALSKALARLRKHLGADEAAVAALEVDAESLAFALRRAEMSGHPAPTRFEGFGQYLPHAERIAAAQLVHGAFALRGAYSMAWPVASDASVSSPYGYRSHPVLGRRRLHKGVDLRVAVGTPVSAAQSGQVAFAGRDGINGRFIRLDHGHGLTTTYCHLDRIAVTRGQSVLRGDPIGESGNSGRTTGPHLHFQVEFDGTTVDPELFR